VIGRRRERKEKTSMRISRSLVLLACGFGLFTLVIGCTKPPGAPDLGVAAPAAPRGPLPSAPPRPDEFTAQATLEDVHFDLDQSDIRPDAARILDRSAEWLLEHPEYVVLIEGHGDAQGTTDYNLALGDLRAQMTREYLVARGVARARVITISYGEERPVCAERGANCSSRNRRAHVLVKAP
jgi:peptidoglycan-associated lipoprotein